MRLEFARDADLTVSPDHFLRRSIVHNKKSVLRLILPLTSNYGLARPELPSQIAALVSRRFGLNSEAIVTC
jgi:hypothetical protein